VVVAIRKKIGVPVKLIWKFNLALLGIFVLGFIICGTVSYRMLQSNAREEILDDARMIMEAALAARSYTNNQIKPLLETQLKYTFLPQSIPHYAAIEQFNEMKKKFPEFSYKEATLNPTNPRDRAVEWEAELVNQFRADPVKTELVGERDMPTGRVLYLAQPIVIKDPACLVCHSTVAAAPKTMIELYGQANGFGWKLNEVVGAQIVSVPSALPVQRANRIFRWFMVLYTVVFILIIALLNVMLHTMVIRRVKQLSRLADEVSLGHLEAAEFPSKSKDEIGVLSGALSRMNKSLVQAIKMLEE
jgi:HAMP domain-containing protein